jgi:hypothetical protein
MISYCSGRKKMMRIFMELRDVMRRNISKI